MPSIAITVGQVSNTLSGHSTRLYAQL